MAAARMVEWKVTAASLTMKGKATAAARCCGGECEIIFSGRISFRRKIQSVLWLKLIIIHSKFMDDSVQR